MTSYTTIAPPTETSTLSSAAQIQHGPPVLPIARIRLYSSGEWEEFTNEWAHAYLRRSYVDVVRFSGANDRGVDVAGFADNGGFIGIWDGFQCKHYDKPLAPAAAKTEIGKILWHSFNGEYSAPRSYCFVAPCGIGTTLNNLLKDAGRLKSDVMATWDKVCLKEISSTQDVLLSGSFKEYVEAFDFAVFNAIQPLDIIEQHKVSPYHLTRFGGGFPARPHSEKPPGAIAPHESRYVGQLLEAYSDHTKEPVTQPDDLSRWSHLHGHFSRQRESFYQAETLRVFVRDKVEPGTFERLQDEILSGVVDTHDEQHEDGYARVRAVTKAAQDMSLTANPIAPIAQTQDRHGICHQLANEDRLKWTK